MSFRKRVRGVLGLHGYSDSIEERLTARHALSLRLIGKRSGERVLDVGASYGWLEKVGPRETGAEYVGVEYDTRNLAEAKKNVSSATILQGSVLSLPFPDASFDGATMFEVLEHIPVGTEPTAFKEIHRVLKPQGWFVLSTPFDDIRSRLLDPAAYVGHRHYASERVEALLRESGFAVDHVAVKGGWWECFSMILLYGFKHILGAETACKAFFERRRAEEFLGEKTGFSTLFLRAVRG